MFRSACVTFSTNYLWDRIKETSISTPLIIWRNKSYYEVHCAWRRWNPLCSLSQWFIHNASFLFPHSICDSRRRKWNELGSWVLKQWVPDESDWQGQIGVNTTAQQLISVVLFWALFCLKSSPWKSWMDKEGWNYFCWAEQKNRPALPCPICTPARLLQWLHTEVLMTHPDRPPFRWHQNRSAICVLLLFRFSVLQVFL